MRGASHEPRGLDPRGAPEPLAAESYDRAAAIFGGTRTPMLVARNGGTFPQALFVKLRQAGWPVSPVLEGRVQIGGRSLRLLGIEPVTLPAEVGNAPTIGKASLQTFITPPGQTLAAPDTLGDLRLAEGASPTASNGTALRRRSWCPTCWWSISGWRRSS